ncbi:hypothetical protein CN899_12150 [Bacillus thuringiensis]|uniref:Uncharacterized protein n=1 Tax=Bacillus thuringiensis TaxID=1428 RepID=A0A9X7C068_BACTU|nr:MULTISPECIES: hypothetical protein [Bacillus cereus group]PEJ54004.1 hypothetical protein CN672_01410 [Bacillus wiedmannii]PGD10536.1 hypothetical protein COM34_06575 [Bacillus wiedmannii]PGH84090.1 hypothetical protein CN899_12150 [Bacillus thuringiensis]
MGKILYFPSISIPKSQWLMGALFYWDKVGSIVPLEFLDEPNLLGEHMRKLVEAGLIEQVVPEEHLWNVPNFEEAFINFIDNSPVFLPISNLGKLGLIGQNGVIKTTTEIHMGKLRSLGQKLEQRGLATKGRGSWYTVEGYTASNFMTYLATVLGTITEYTPLTDSYNELSYFLPKTEKEHTRDLLKEQLRARIIEKILPVPVSVEDPYDIFRFKEKHYDRLTRFRRYIEEFILNLELLPEYQVEERIKIFSENSHDEIREISDRMESFKWRMINFATLCSIASPALGLVKGISEDDVLDTASATIGLLGAVGTAFGREKLLEIERQPLAYAAIVERDFNKPSSNSIFTPS